MSVFRDHEVDNREPRCPKCGSPVVWVLHNSKPGAKTSTRCTKHPTQSRVDFKPETDSFCMWEGIVTRTRAGKVEFFDGDGRTRLRIK
jgi:hypothetical protein